MVTSVIALLFLSLAVFGLSILTDRRTEECWPVCFCGTVAWLYGFYCFGFVRLGLILLCAGMVVLFLAGWRKLGSLRGCLLRFFTPGTVMYLCFCLIFLVFFSGNVVSRHDELRLWGAVPKAIHATGKLQLGPDSPVFSTMQSYPPGLPLLGYFFTAFSKEFAEGALFVGYACMTLSFFTPAFSKWEWKHWPLLAPVGLVVLMTPFVFTSHFQDACLFGMTLYVDAILGVTAGAAFYLAGHRPLRDWFRLAAFSLTLFVLCLLKDTGALFAVTALIVTVFLEKRNWKLLVPASAVLAGVGSWKLLLQVYHVHALVPLKMHLLSGEAIRNVLRALVSNNVIAVDVPLGFFLSFLFVFPVLWAVYILVFRLQREQGRGEAAAVAVGILVSTAAFIYGYSLIYGETLESYARYMETPLLGLFTCILLTAIPALPQWKISGWVLSWKKKLSVCALSLCVFVGVGVTAAWQYVFPLSPAIPDAGRDAARIRAAVEQDLSQGETGWIFLVMAGDGLENSFYHHRVFFDLISSNINIRNGLAQTQVVIPGLENPEEVWARELADGYDYVYLLSVEDALLPVFAELSEDPAQEHGLYRVCREENDYGVSLRRVPSQAAE